MGPQPLFWLLLIAALVGTFAALLPALEFLNIEGWEGWLFATGLAVALLATAKGAGAVESWVHHERARAARVGGPAPRLTRAVGPLLVAATMVAAVGFVWALAILRNASTQFDPAQESTASVDPQIALVAFLAVSAFELVVGAMLAYLANTPDADEADRRAKEARASRSAAVALEDEAVQLRESHEATWNRIQLTKAEYGELIAARLSFGNELLALYEGAYRRALRWPGEVEFVGERGPLTTEDVGWLLDLPPSTPTPMFSEPPPPLGQPSAISKQHENGAQ